MVKVREPLSIVDGLDVLDHLEPYIQRIIDKADGCTLERLKELISRGEATLHPFGNEGFIIATWSDSEMFVVSAAAFDLRCLNLSECISAAYDYAKQLNCCRIGFRSKRKAWIRVAASSGFTRVGVDYYSKEIP